jgi:hypothetical protein
MSSEVPSFSGEQDSRKDPYELWEQMRLLQKAEFLTTSDVTQLIEQLPENAVDEVYRKVVSAIQEETNLFSDLEDVGIYENLLNHDFHNLAGVKVERYSFVRNPSYLPGKNVILLDTKDVNKKDLLSEFASGDGNFVETLLHESLHGVQEQRTTALARIMNYIKSRGSQTNTDIEILESQAYQTGFSLEPPKQKKSHPSLADDPSLLDYAEVFNEANSKIDEIFPYIPGVPQEKQGFDKQGKRSYIDIKKFTEAYVVIQQLRALGLSAHEIADLIAKKGVWERKNGAYGELDRFIAEKTREHFGLNANAPYEADLGTLVDVYKIEKVIDRLKARKLAQEILSESLAQ